MYPNDYITSLQLSNLILHPAYSFWHVAFGVNDVQHVTMRQGIFFQLYVIPNEIFREEGEK